ncbi:MAG: hypothetical protein HFH07_12790 [Dorea sp.]|jgi:hypothetical protein|nr:hypothetical protein [Dorea sp.]
MGTYREKEKYYTSTDYYSSTAYQEYSGDDYIEFGPDELDSYNNYDEEFDDYSEGFDDYSESSLDHLDYSAYAEESYDDQPEDFQSHQAAWQYDEYEPGYQNAHQTAYDDSYAQGYQNARQTADGAGYAQEYQGYRQTAYADHARQEANERQRQQPQQPVYRRSAQSYRFGSDYDMQPEPDEEEILRRREARRRRKIREEKRRRRRKRLLIALSVRLACMCIALIAVISIFRLLFFSSPVKRKVTVEAGKELDVKDFLKKEKTEGKFVTDISKISLDHVGEHEIILKVKGKERKSRLIVEDTKAPKGEPVSVVIDVDGELKAKELVENIQDATDVKCSFKKEPDLSKKGKISAVVILTDEGGNTTEVESDVKVIVDKEAPVIDGVAPLTGFIGEPISYKSSITVTDNCVRDIDVTVDNSKVDTKTEGTYDVFYTAVDRAGNKAEASTTITIKEKPKNYVAPEEALEEADEVLKEIITKGMTKKEKAKAIYDWVRANVAYVNKSDKDSWTNGAHQGFTQNSGDCFVFFATAKALLTQAEIPNLDVVKSDTSHSSHYWSLIDCGDGWYHFDTTPRTGGDDDFFMKTDEQILKYSKAHKNSHIFDQSLYPATPTEDSTVK